jgi:hypothetical protein|tara:strand:- start:14 stop:427 length:414 start_codon:yes stop_codon:yes gene_type:complete
MIIRKIKETLGQVFHSPEASGTWEDNIECSIDEEVVECDEMDSPPYTGIPAPILNPVDEWFASPYGCPSAITEKQQDYMEREVEAKMEESLNTKEPENIHQLMYEMATKSGSTTLHLDPIGGSENFQGGSENIQKTP